MLAVLGIAPWLALITVATLPTAWKLIRLAAQETEAKALHPLLRQTARLHMQFGGLLIVGYIAAWFVGSYWRP